MSFRNATLWLAVLVIAGAGTLGAQKGKKLASGGPSDAVFRDLGNPEDPAPDRIRSDGFQTALCASGVAGENSRYCGGTYTSPETGLTYDGVGPECSRISHGSSGYAFRTRSSKCSTSEPLDVGQRRVVLDFSESLSGVCKTPDPDDDLVTITIDGHPRTLDACGYNLVDDVQIIADGMFSNSTSSTRLHISLHSPDLANTTQFLLEFSSPLSVIDRGDARELIADASHIAVLSRTTVGNGGKLQKTFMGEYRMPFAVTARKAPMPTFE